MWLLLAALEATSRIGLLAKPWPCYNSFARSPDFWPFKGKKFCFIFLLITHDVGKIVSTVLRIIYALINSEMNPFIQDALYIQWTQNVPRRPSKFGRRSTGPALFSMLVGDFLHERSDVTVEQSADVNIILLLKSKETKDYKDEVISALKKITKGSTANIENICCDREHLLQHTSCFQRNLWN